MNKSLSTWRFLLKQLQQNIPVMMLYVLDSKGSSPGRQGFFMGVTQNGEMEGSVGGGIMEHKFVELAKEKLKSSSNEISIRKQIHDKAAANNQSGMICSGEQTILLYALKIEDLNTIDSIVSTLLQNKNGSLRISPTGLHFENELPQKDFYYQYDSENDWLYEEKIGYKNHLFIVGGGHCALAFSELLLQADISECNPVHCENAIPHASDSHERVSDNHPISLHISSLD